MDAPWYLAELTAIGYVPLPAIAIFLAWLAVAGQLIALESYRYAPYPTAAERKGRGPFRTGMRRLVSNRAARIRRTSSPNGAPPAAGTEASAQNEIPHLRTCRKLPLPARNVHEDVRGGSPRDHVRFLPAQRRDSGQRVPIQAIST